MKSLSQIVAAAGIIVLLKEPVATLIASHVIKMMPIFVQSVETIWLAAFHTRDAFTLAPFERMR